VLYGRQAMFRREFIKNAASVPFLDTTIGGKKDKEEECLKRRMDSLLIDINKEFGGRWTLTADEKKEFFLFAKIGH
jgi:hypothetical protein